MTRPLARWVCMLVALLALPAAAVPAAAQDHHLERFERTRLSDRFYAEGAAVGDLNRDGAPDVVAGPYWYAGPRFTERHTLYEPKEFDPEQYSDNFFAYVHDLDADGWNDVLVIGFPGEEARWYRNPGRGGGGWARHDVFRGVDNESPTWTDLTGDGRPEMVAIHRGRYGFIEPDWKDPTRPWTFHQVTPMGSWQKFTHGLGVGDVNRDGRMDLLEKDGWWEHPAGGAKSALWRHHPVAFGGGGAQMHAYDFDGDGDNDVVTSLQAHGYGLAWFEQVRDTGGERRWLRHVIMNERPEESRYGLNLSQMHAVALADMDGDGVRDIVTGKRYWAHGSRGDADPNAPPVIYWLRTVRQGRARGVDFVPHLIDDDSGVGTDVVVADVNRDRIPDVVSSNKKGTVVIVHRRVPVSRERWESAQPRPRP